MEAQKLLAIQTRLKDANLLLQAIHAVLQLEQLGAKRHLVELLLDPIQAFFHSLQPSDEHVVFSLQPIEALVDAVEMAVDLVEAGIHPLFEGVDRFPYDALHVRDEDFPMKAGQDRQEVFGHVPDPTPGLAAMGPEKNRPLPTRRLRLFSPRLQPAKLVLEDAAQRLL